MSTIRNICAIGDVRVANCEPTSRIPVVHKDKGVQLRTPENHRFQDTKSLVDMTKLEELKQAIESSDPFTGAKLLWSASESQFHSLYGYKTMPDLVAKELGYSKSWCNMRIRIVARFFDKDTPCTVFERGGKDFTLTQLQMLLPFSCEEIQIWLDRGLIDYGMSCREFSQAVKEASALSSEDLSESGIIWMDNFGNQIASKDAVEGCLQLVPRQGSNLYQVQRMYKNGYWKDIYVGTLESVKPFLERENNIQSRHPTAYRESEISAPYKVYNRLGPDCKLSIKQVSDFLYLCMWRNCRCGNTPLINIRLLDSFGQNIYVLDRGWRIGGTENLRDLVVVETLSQANEIYDGSTIAALPHPIQWSSDMRDYVWDPSLELCPISSSTFRHIMEERRDRFPKSIQRIPIDAAFRYVKAAVQRGARLASTNAFYAIPSFSKKFNRVNMMLPLYLFASDDQLPEGVLLLNKTHCGYSLYTIITPQQAYMGAILFVNPENTWLHGALDSEF